ncbi:hypothetical protein RM543_08810 [Roseicyclus sp. F158]|uniref:Excalibur calcium-binding domain-containing protein n=1 Tax=Tropicimonas omnivorans TaxID=3075590 RepID=A0ABU3DGF2_9RHOB|nr:hypothetical protein [Roseicyclus sp. F158]MDT0682786.1 hypothetical protein [Roseicyclus sp. F158]
MIRSIHSSTALIALAALALSACQPAVPDSAAQFDDRVSFETARAGQATGSLPVLPPEATGAPAVNSSDVDGLSSSDLAAAGIGAQGSTSTSSYPPPEAVVVEPVPGAVISPPGSAELSDEQNFKAVAERETIESDAERLERQRAQYRQVQPGQLPQRTGEGGPNIVAYALQTSNSVGQPLYRRMFASADKARRNCANYPSPDVAQRDFLARGGPQRDRLGIDPDGDGFACSWDPSGFRAARS